MRVLRTLPLHAALVGCTALLSACDTSVTRPPEPQAKPDAILIGLGTCWCRTDLPFAPAAINDAGTVVGTNGTEAVVWQNGVLDTLQHSVVLPGPYKAVAISPNGAILGAANGHAIFWRTATDAPNDASAGFAQYMYPMAITDSYTIMTYAWYGYGFTSYRWTPTGGWVDVGAGLGLSGADQTIVLSMNNYGQATGYHWLANSGTYLPVRWGATGGPVQLPAPIDFTGWPSGRGISIDAAGNIFGFTSAGTTIWHPDNSSVLVTGLPGQPSLRSNSGRFIGVAYNGGVIQQPFTSFNGTLTWLSNSDATAPTMVGVNSCGTIIANRATANTGYLWKRTGISYSNTCDVQLTYNAPAMY